MGAEGVEEFDEVHTAQVECGDGDEDELELVVTGLTGVVDEELLLELEEELELDV